MNEDIEDERSQSVYGTFKNEPYKFSDVKSQFQNMITQRTSSAGDGRYTIIEAAKTLRDEIDFMYEGDELLKVNSPINDMIVFDKRLARSTRDSQAFEQDIKLFQHYAHKFIKEWNNVLVIHGFGAKMKKNMSPLDKLYVSGDVGNNKAFMNQYGILISPEMEVFCRMLSARTKVKRDNPIMIEGPVGEGKSSFSYAVATTLAPMLSVPFDLNYNMVFNESKEYVNKLIKTANPFSIFDFDEAGNQLNKKTWWQEDQIGFTNMLNLIRFHGITFLFNWTDVKELDKTIRDTRIKFVVSIKERGTALVQVFNLNPYSPKEFKPKAAKGKIAFNSQESSEMIEDYNPLTLLKIPFYEITGDAWERYLKRKEKSLNSFTLGKGSAAYMTSSDLETEYLLSLPMDKFRLSWEEVNEHAAKVGWAMNIRKLAKNIAKSTGQRIAQVYEFGDLAKPDEGFINITPVIRGYIERLRQMKIGAQQQRELAKKPDEKNE